MTTNQMLVTLVISSLAWGAFAYWAAYHLFPPIYFG